MAWHIEVILSMLRDGRELPEDAIYALIQGVVDGTVSRPQAAAFLAWAFTRGLTEPETLALTRAMTETGDQLVWPEGPPLIDKHSTGGVGDKVSLALAPLWAELGNRVPMISGRGLEQTGGTLDKLESIPGYRTDLSTEELQGTLARVGCFISGQTARLAPADRVLYALRNETCTVPSIPLIVGSILSKKLAEGVEELVLDVKVGTGAFMKDVGEARALAEALVEVATDAGLRCRALLTEMSRPLGRAIGNALEVEEAVACLKGEGPPDLRALVVALAGDPRAEDVLDSGAALDRFGRMVEAQGGDRRALERGDLLGGGASRTVVAASTAGVIQRVDALAMGRAAFLLGAGRRRAEDPVDPGVGLLVHVSPGTSVEVGQPIVEIVHRDGRALEQARQLVEDAIEVGDAPVEPAPLLIDSVG